MATIKFVDESGELYWLVTFHEQQDQPEMVVSMSEWQINSLLYCFTGKTMYGF